MVFDCLSPSGITGLPDSAKSMPVHSDPVLQAHTAKMLVWSDSPHCPTHKCTAVCKPTLAVQKHTHHLESTPVLCNCDKTAYTSSHLNASHTLSPPPPHTQHLVPISADGTRPPKWSKQYSKVTSKVLPFHSVQAFILFRSLNKWSFPQTPPPECTGMITLTVYTSMMCNT